MVAPRVTDRHRKELEAALAAALLARYMRSKNAAHASLGASPVEPSADDLATVGAFAAERAHKAQNGVNDRIDSALNALGPGATPTAIAAAIRSARRGMLDYNTGTLAPWLGKWADNHGRIAAYADTPANDGSGRSLRDAIDWIWIQNTDYDDSCAAAAAASPASYKTLVGLAGKEPQVHDGCQCDFYPAE